jgi:hypothetical protein
MSAFDAITQSGTLADLADKAQAVDDTYSSAKKPVSLLEADDMFHAGLARVMECYRNLATASAIPGTGLHDCESLSEKAMTLGKALRDVASRTASLESLLLLRGQDALDIQESIQMVRLLNISIASIYNDVVSFWIFHSHPIPSALVPLISSSKLPIEVIRCPVHF